MSDKVKTYSLKEWRAKGKELYGTDDILEWPLVCPNCGTIQKGIDLLQEGMEADKALNYLGFSCIGRFNSKNKKGCDWSLGGLFQIHEVEIEMDGDTRPVFNFHEEGKE
jgi:hypothetical protein